MAKLHLVKQLLTDGSLIGTEITVNGWLRSKRDSKAGISFLAVNDGSHFDSLQCVAPMDLDNYESEVLKLSTGCAVCITGQLVASQGGGQAVEIQASTVVLLGDVDDPESYPIAKKRHTFAVSYTHLRAHETKANLVCRLLLEKKKKNKKNKKKKI